MARGWESKSVESQIELAEARRAAAQAIKISSEQAERNRRRESLLLSRKRVLHDLENAHNPRYRQTLESALQHLDQRLAELG